MSRRQARSATSCGSAAARPGARCRRSRSAQRGVALILVLWTGALLSVIAAGFAFGIRTDTASVVTATARLQAEALAESAVRRAVLGLLDPDPVTRWQADGRIYEEWFEGGLLRASIGTETGKIDLNAAPGAFLEGLIAAAQGSVNASAIGPAELAAAILDWRDSDARPRPSGAEDPEYRAAGLDHGAGDRAFLSVDELGQVLGMSRALVERLRPAVTVYSHSPRIDPMTAPELVLFAVPGLDPEQARTFLAERRRLLDASRQDPTALSESLQAALRLLAGAEDYLSRSRSRVLTVLAEGQTSEGVTAFRQAVVRIDSSQPRPYQLLAWADEPMALGPSLTAPDSTGVSGE